jgi:hypothetical protein
LPTDNKICSIIHYPNNITAKGMVPASLQSNRKPEKQADMHTNIYLLINILGAEMVVNGMFGVHNFIRCLKHNTAIRG